ncbi:MAG: hypothetical protein ABIO44_13440, partial [Saprospiraceae bacterium]
MKTQLFVYLIILSNLTVSIAQNDLNKAKELNSKSQNEQALKTLEQSCLMYPNDANIQLALARSYKANGQNSNSLKLYRQITSQKNAEASSILEYADLLRTETEYSAAKEQYIRYSAFNPALGAYFAGACDFALNQLSNPSHCKIEKLNSDNTMAVVYKDEVRTNSKSIYDIAIKEAIPANPTAPILTKKTTTNQNRLDEILKTSSIENTNISFNEDGNMVAFSQNSNLHSDRTNTTIQNRKIFFANVNDKGNWSDISEFTYNNSSYSVCYPSLANNGRTLYFSSNMTGGFGGYDLYVSHLIDNKWTSPNNLGAIINTPGNELSPFYKNGDLFFSSDWQQGFGGFDIFRTSHYGISWTDVENLGTCVNSSKDDYN